MAAPDYVPTETGPANRHYVSPPRLPQPWLAGRPAELTGGQPQGTGMGVPGPDQGYALRLARRFEQELLLEAGEEVEDVIAGCLGLALKRAAAFGRAPVMADLRVAFMLFGYLPPAAGTTFLAWRRKLFAEVSNPHHYLEARHLVNLVPEEILRLTPDEVEAACSPDRSGFFAESTESIV
ncbi:hypothetical protein [Candidatus Poriferisocius sp.]|uniref:hypothetical protein n=1 Tax=Candidatus Poriferisocius sp. TaxID=3101276 RepID=UPI003B01E386